MHPSVICLVKFRIVYTFLRPYATTQPARFGQNRRPTFAWKKKTNSKVIDEEVPMPTDPPSQYFIDI